MASWVEMGQDPALFWTLTLREIDTVMRGCLERRRRDHNAAAWLAWHIAYLTTYAPQKSREFVKLDKLTWKDAPAAKARASDWRKQLAKVSAWVKGGK